MRFVVLRKRLISRISNQQELLAALIRHLKNRTCLSREDCDFYDQTTKQVERNLRNVKSFILNEAPNIKKENKL